VSVTAALQQISESDLPAKTAASAAKLLLQVHPDNGHACLSWQQLCDVLGLAAGTAQRHLTQLHQARVIHYSSNGDGLVYVTFKAWVLQTRSDRLLGSTGSSTGIDDPVDLDRRSETNGELTASK
jgi:hypothetical protein